MEDFFPNIEPGSVQTVSELNREIKKALEPKFNQVWVKGEISNLRFQQSGHYYFSIKDESSQLPCVFFNRFASACDFELEDGVEVILYGDISVYEPYGRYQISVKIAHLAGKGNLHLLFEQLKKKFHKEGLFNEAHKKAIPKIPKRIALITSPTGAAVQDFIRILRRRNFSGKIDLIPVKVQGQQARNEIIEAIEYVSSNQNRYDLVVLTRGGGSIEDLWNFNEESVARALFKCLVPCISAIGHQIDTVLTDLIADCRAETPSGAAELISSNFLLNKEMLEARRRQLSENMMRIIQGEKIKLQTNSQKLVIHTPLNYVDKLMIQMDVIEKKLSQNLAKAIKVKTAKYFSINAQFMELHPKKRLETSLLESKMLKKQLEQLSQDCLKTKRQILEFAQIRLQNSSIHTTLKRGYVILKDKKDNLLANLEMAKNTNEIEAHFAEGKLNLYNRTK